MLTPAKLNATYQDVLDAPENMRAELLDGRLYLQARPRGNHQLAAGRLFSRLDAAAREMGWVFLPEVELHLGGDVLTPDISGWRVERATEGLEVAGYKVAPDWVCEVLSPSTRKYDSDDKRAKYLRNGIGALWEVDPVERVVEVYALENGQYVWRETMGGDDGGRLWPFEQVVLELAHLWSH